MQRNQVDWQINDPIITDRVENKTILITRWRSPQRSSRQYASDSTPSDKTPTFDTKAIGHLTTINNKQRLSVIIKSNQHRPVKVIHRNHQRRATIINNQHRIVIIIDKRIGGDTNTNEVPVTVTVIHTTVNTNWWDYNQYQTNWSGGAKVAAKKLEKFNGDPLAYHTFRKTIQHYVVDNPQIRGNANKIMEIIDLLPHKDRYIIECFNPDTCTMASIMAELDEHYASPNRIIPALVDRLRKAPFLSLRPSERDWEALVEVAILIRNTLSSANLASEERSLVGVLLQKIDRAHFMHIGDKRAITLEQILQYFKTGLDRERTATSQIASSDLNVKSTNRPNMQANRPTKNVMFATSTTTCMFADGNHKTENCPLTIQERRKIAIEKRMCFRCGGFRHNSKDCNRRLKCAICSRNHTTYLCNDLKPSSSSSSS
ncbi:hypothetical protein HUG17_6059 [Dermatophagoides farinae]|uniref:CCHC-type domain-containing protein n=1 Tax=Dermatophagoides farinae TaxID=6954 RepID=A0A9D4P438_DERFA|nr:hypothetical protein HUG17_6059 [Dermatophagoides farinae]